MMALKLYLWVLKWLGSSQKRILESKRLADVIFISPPVPKKKQLREILVALYKVQLTSCRAHQESQQR